MINKMRLQELDNISKKLTNEELQALIVMVGARNMQDIYIDMSAEDEMFDQEQPVVVMNFDNVWDTTSDYLLSHEEISVVNSRYNIVDHYSVDLGFVRKPTGFCKSFA